MWDNFLEIWIILYIYCMKAVKLKMFFFLYLVNFDNITDLFEVKEVTSSPSWHYYQNLFQAKKTLMPTSASYSCYFYYCVDHSFIFYILLSVQIITPVIAPVFNGIRGQAQLQMHQHINAKNCINGKNDKCILCTRCKGIGLKYILGNQNPRKWEVS